jgi:hypothetical protein
MKMSPPFAQLTLVVVPRAVGRDATIDLDLATIGQQVHHAGFHATGVKAVPVDHRLGGALFDAHLLARLADRALAFRHPPAPGQGLRPSQPDRDKAQSQHAHTAQHHAQIPGANGCTSTLAFALTASVFAHGHQGAQAFGIVGFVAKSAHG